MVMSMEYILTVSEAACTSSDLETVGQLPIGALWLVFEGLAIHG